MSSEGLRANADEHHVTSTPASSVACPTTSRPRPRAPSMTLTFHPGAQRTVRSLISRCSARTRAPLKQKTKQRLSGPRLLHDDTLLIRRAVLLIAAARE